MIITSYICDRCDRSQVKSDQIWNVAIVIRPYGAYIDPSAHKHLWCRRCVDEVGLLLPPAPVPVKADTTPTTPTLEDMIRAIVRNETDGG